MKQLWIILGFVILWAPAQSQAQEQQRGFAKRVIVGTSLTYIPNSDEPNTNFTLHELTWSANASISVTKKIHVSWSYMHIYTSGSLTGLNIEPETYFTTGVFGQYDFLQYEKLRIYGQLSYDFGNYCTYDLPRPEPSKVEGVNYAGWGLGLTYRLAKYVSEDLAFDSRYLLNMKEFRPYAYTLYIIGINLDIE